MPTIPEELAQALAGYPYGVAPEERGAAFDELVRRFDAPTLVFGIAREKREGLLPFLEAAQASEALSAPPAQGSGALVWLEADEPYENDFTSSVFSTLEKAEAGLEVVEEPPSVLSRERFWALAERFDGAGGIVCPLSSSRALALDLLLARLLRLGVAGVAPLPLTPALGADGGLPDLMVVAQALSVVVVPKSVNATFWTMAAHAEIVDAERADSEATLARAIVRALAHPTRPERKATPRKGASLEGALARAGASGLSGWQGLSFPPLVAPAPKESEEARTIEALRRENEALRAEVERLRAKGGDASA